MAKVTTAEEAASKVGDGATILMGGFLGHGSPNAIIDELVRQGRKDLTLITNDTWRPGLSNGKLIRAKAVRKLICTHIGTNSETQAQYNAGEIEIEFCPQGTFVERIRAGGFGLGAVVTPTGYGTKVAEGKRTIEIDGKGYLVELPLKADFALVGVHRADYLGNLQFAWTDRNFGPVMIPAGDTVIVEVNELVPTGSIPPDQVAVPHILVDHIVVRG